MCVKGNRRGYVHPSNPKSFYAFYDTSLSCADGTLSPVTVRFSCPPQVEIFPDGTVVFMIGSVYIAPKEELSLIEAKHMLPVPGNAAAPGYQNVIPLFRHSHINCVGTICGPPYSLQDRSIVVPICLSDTVHGEMKSFQMMYAVFLETFYMSNLKSTNRCLFSGEVPRWSIAPLPSLGTIIQVSGLCSRILSSGLMAFTVDEIAYDSSLECPPRPFRTEHRLEYNSDKPFNAYPPCDWYVDFFRTIGLFLTTLM